MSSPTQTLRALSRVRIATPRTATDFSPGSTPKNGPTTTAAGSTRDRPRRAPRMPARTVATGRRAPVQQSFGPQISRAAGILQLLLGNIGRPGGGIMALRGHASIQGSTDVPTLFDLLPGYLPQPSTLKDDQTLQSYLKGATVNAGYWANLPKFMISLLKAWYGDAATATNDFGYDWIGKITGDHSHITTAAAMADGNVRGFVVFGQNPAAGSPNARLQRKALRQLDWLVAIDLFETETAAFWYAGPEHPNPADIKTEVFMIPTAA